jgi:hypothetical protein
MHDDDTEMSDDDQYEQDPDVVEDEVQDEEFVDPSTEGPKSAKASPANKEPAMKIPRRPKVYDDIPEISKVTLLWRGTQRLRFCSMLVLVHVNNPTKQCKLV